MRASHEWLRAFVPHDLTAAEVERLISTHVATVDKVEALRADLAPIVVGRVLEAGRHPDSDHLWLTKVDDGSGTPLEVVCGAANVVVGTLYPFARTGTVMPNGMKIEKRKIRGVVSNGMLCSARELGLGDDHEGILTLTVDAKPGTPFLDVMPVGDVAYEVDVLPNRPDLLCHVGLARELAALTRTKLRVPAEVEGAPLPKKAVAAAKQGKTGGVRVQIDDLDGCPRYLAIVIRGVTVGPSPQWLKDRFAAVGVRSISNVVDVTNYFLHAFGQPMHAFDLAKLAGPAIVVRRARAGEKLVTLDGVPRTLTPDMLVIADADRAQAVAGVIGGKDSEVSDATRDILLEVANFEPRTVRKTRRALGVNTDASHRFERGTDPAEPARAGALAAALIASLGGGSVDGAPLLVGSAAKSHKAVELKPVRAARLLGAKVTGADVTKLLTPIGFKVTKRGAALVAVPPSWRHDVSRDVDLIEEIARLRGYDQLSDELRPFRPSAAPDDSLFTRSLRVREALVAAGFAEVRPLPFVRGDASTHVRVSNPLAEDEPYLRTSVLESLSGRAEYNLARREGNVRLFEIGSAFAPNANGVREECRVGVLLMGARRPAHFTEPSPPSFDAWDAKGLANEVATSAFPGRSVSINEGDASGGALWTIDVDGAQAGVVRQLTLDAPPWASAAFGIELSLGALSAAPVAARGAHAYEAAASTDAVAIAHYRALPVMPSASFDLAFIVPPTLSAAKVEDALRKAGGELLERIELFDEFTRGMAAGSRSLAWRLTFRHPERTLNEKEIAGRRDRLIATLKKELNVDVRTG